MHESSEMYYLNRKKKSLEVACVVKTLDITGKKIINFFFFFFSI